MLKKIKDKSINLNDYIDNNILLAEKNNHIFDVNNFPNPILNKVLNIALKENITDIYFCLYRVSQRQLKIFERAINIEKFPVKVNLILSGSIQRLIKGTSKYLINNNNFNVKYIDTHAKYCILKTKQGNYYCIFSSGNSNPDGKIEQTDMFNDENLYFLAKDFLDKVLSNKIKC